MINEDKISQNYMQLYCISYIGQIQGNKKYEKLCFELKESLDKNGYKCAQNFNFKRNDFGPRDPGISRANLKYESMGILEIDKELNNKPTTYRLTEKGARWLEGLTLFYSKTILEFPKIKNIIDNSLQENKDLSGSKIAEKESVQKAKKELLGKKL